jgi:hypothetical protein
MEVGRMFVNKGDYENNQDKCVCVKIVGPL